MTKVSPPKSSAPGNVWHAPHSWCPTLGRKHQSPPRGHPRPQQTSQGFWASVSGASGRGGRAGSSSKGRIGWQVSARSRQSCRRRECGPGAFGGSSRGRSPSPWRHSGCGTRWGSQRCRPAGKGEEHCYVMPKEQCTLHLRKPGTVLKNENRVEITLKKTD